MLYLERPGCNHAWVGNQAAKGDTVMATSTRLFKEELLEDSEGKKESLLFVYFVVFYLS
jgi:aconitate hydratase 2/2-methylisocitrate dehydratase